MHKKSIYICDQKVERMIEWAIQLAQPFKEGNVLSCLEKKYCWLNITGVLMLIGSHSPHSFLELIIRPFQRKVVVLTAQWEKNSLNHVLNTYDTAIQSGIGLPEQWLARRNIALSQMLVR